MLASSNDMDGPSCSFGTRCKHPATEITKACSSTCAAMIHPSCAPLDRCPNHGNDLAGRVAGMLSSVPSPPATNACAPLSTKYRTAVLRDGTIFDAIKSEVKTKYGDTAYVFEVSKDGNCLIISLVRGFNGGLPLSPAQEEQAMIELRTLLAEVMRNHQWPHPYIASPQTIDECITSTATPGEWCGEVAMVSTAMIGHCAIQCWRYINDDPSCGIIEHLMSIINPGVGLDGRLVINILQTRVALPGRPEHAAHWQSIHLLPISVPSPRIILGECVTKDNYHIYDSVEDNKVRYEPKKMVRLRGRGATKKHHIIHQIRQSTAVVAGDISTSLQLMIIIYDKHGNGIITPKLLSDIIQTNVRDATIDELNQYNTFLVPAPSTPVIVTPIIVTPKRHRTPAKLFQAPAPTAARKLVLKKSQDEKKKKEIILTSDDDDEVEEVEPPKKKKKTPTKVNVITAHADDEPPHIDIISSPPRLPLPPPATIIPTAPVHTPTPTPTPEQSISLLQSLLSSVAHANNNDFSSLVPSTSHLPHHIPRYTSLTSHLFNTLRDVRNRQEIDTQMHALQHQFEVQSNQLDWFRTQLSALYKKQ